MANTAEKPKRVVVLSDLHCGSIFGLTPPTWQDGLSSRAGKERRAAAKTREALWNMFADKIKSLQPIDTLIVNGDAIDGREERQGGLELLTPDREEQASMAAECIRFCKTDKVFLTYGTAYHTGQIEDWERLVAKEVKANPNYQPEVDITSHLYMKAGGVVFDCKHFIGASNIPHGRATSILKEKLWNTLWALDGVVPEAQVVIRSHVHYHQYSGRPGFVAMTTPALMAMGSRYGSRQCSGIVDWGFVHFSVSDGRVLSWSAFIPPEAAKVQKVTVRNG